MPGRRKIFHLLGLLGMAASFFFMWHECLGCSATPVPYQVLYFSCLVVIFEFSRASAYISQLALIPELTADKSVQVELVSIRYNKIYLRVTGVKLAS